DMVVLEVFTGRLIPARQRELGLFVEREQFLLDRAVFENGAVHERVVPREDFLHAGGHGSWQRPLLCSFLRHRCSGHWWPPLLSSLSSAESTRPRLANLKYAVSPLKFAA